MVSNLYIYGRDYKIIERVYSLRKCHPTILSDTLRGYAAQIKPTTKRYGVQRPHTRPEMERKDHLQYPTDPVHSYFMPKRPYNTISRTRAITAEKGQRARILT